MSEIQAIETPIGDLEWVIISGEGKVNLSGAHKYQADLVLEGEKAEALKEIIDDYWEEHRPKGISKPKSLGYRAHTVRSDEKDENGKWIYTETGKTVFQFRTNVEFTDGSKKKVKVFNAKGAEVALGDKKIGNGSRGRISGAVGVYEVRSKDKKQGLVDAGTTLYLNGLQLTKYVEFVSGPNFSAVDDEESDFEGFGEMGATLDDEEGESSSASEGNRPRL